MAANIEQMILSIIPEVTELRKDFHRHPELAWKEYRTTHRIASYLKDLGFKVITGQPVAGRETGVIADYSFGEGPRLALRFDIDALPVMETDAVSHNPAKHGFRSENSGYMHACGHDGHTAMGLGFAKILPLLKHSLSGSIRLIFQPAEEGARGAKEIVACGWLDHVHYFLSGHIYRHSPDLPADCHLICGVSSSLATTKSDITIKGKAAHAAHPEQGIDVMPAAAEAILLFKKIAPPGFVQVGTIHAGSSRNIIADQALIEMETRAPDTDRDQELNQNVQAILSDLQEKYHVSITKEIRGIAPSVESDPDLCQRLRTMYQEKAPQLQTSNQMYHFSASEDVSHMMLRVKEQGGQSAFFLFPAMLAADLHHEDFDFPTDVLYWGISAYAYAALELLGKKKNPHNS